jgi:hypothetical protein
VFEHFVEYTTSLDRKLRLAFNAYSRIRHQLLDSELAHHREAQNRVTFQRLVQLEQQRHIETYQKYQALCQQHNKLLQDFRQEKDLSDVQKKLISELEGMIEIYQANYLPARAISNEFKAGAVDAPLPAMGFNEMITKQESRNFDETVELDGHQPVSKETMSTHPHATEPDSLKGLYDFGFSTGSAVLQQHNSANELPALPADLKASCNFVMKSPGLQRPCLAMKETPLPTIEEMDLGERCEFKSIAESSHTQFPISALRDTRDYNCLTNSTFPPGSARPTPGSSNMSPKRIIKQDGSRQRKRQRKLKPLSIASPAKMT